MAALLRSFCCWNGANWNIHALCCEFHKVNDESREKEKDKTGRQKGSSERAESWLTRADEPTSR